MKYESTDIHDSGGSLLLAGALALDLGLDGLADGQLAGPLADLRQIRATEALCDLQTTIMSLIFNALTIVTLELFRTNQYNPYFF